MRLAILGTGRLGEALLSGLLRSGAVASGDVQCTVRRTDRAEALSERYGVRAGTDSAAAARQADVVVLAVKPQSLHGLLSEVATVLRPGQTVVSLLAGVRIATIEAALDDGVAVVRVMSNTPVQVDEAMSAVSLGSHAGDAHEELARSLLGAVGRVVVVAEEHLDAVTALSGSGPAYVYLLAEAMIDAGLLLGLPRDVAAELAAQTMVGSAHMLRDSGSDPAALRAAVTSPGGTTIAALRELESAGLRAAVFDAMQAAHRRASQLAGD